MDTAIECRTTKTMSFKEMGSLVGTFVSLPWLVTSSVRIFNVEIDSPT